MNLRLIALIWLFESGFYPEWDITEFEPVTRNGEVLYTAEVYRVNQQEIRYRIYVQIVRGVAVFPIFQALRDMLAPELPVYPGGPD